MPHIFQSQIHEDLLMIPSSMLCIWLSVPGLRLGHHIIKHHISTTIITRTLLSCSWRLLIWAPRRKTFQKPFSWRKFSQKASRLYLLERFPPASISSRSTEASILRQHQHHQEIFMLVTFVMSAPLLEEFSELLQLSACNLASPSCYARIFLPLRSSVSDPHALCPRIWALPHPSMTSWVHHQIPITLRGKAKGKHASAKGANQGCHENSSEWPFLRTSHSSSVSIIPTCEHGDVACCRYGVPWLADVNLQVKMDVAAGLWDNTHSRTAGLEMLPSLAWSACLGWAVHFHHAEFGTSICDQTWVREFMSSDSYVWLGLPNIALFSLVWSNLSSPWIQSHGIVTFRWCLLACKGRAPVNKTIMYNDDIYRRKCPEIMVIDLRGANYVLCTCWQHIAHSLSPFLLSTCLAGRSRAVAAIHAISVVRTAASRRLAAKNEVLYGVEDDVFCPRKRKLNRSMNNSSLVKLVTKLFTWLLYCR